MKFLYTARISLKQYDDSTEDVILLTRQFQHAELMKLPEYCKKYVECSPEFKRQAGFSWIFFQHNVCCEVGEKNKEEGGITFEHTFIDSHVTFRK